MTKIPTLFAFADKKPPARPSLIYSVLISGPGYQPTDRVIYRRQVGIKKLLDEGF